MILRCKTFYIYENNILRLLFIVLALLPIGAKGQELPAYYSISFTNKENSFYSLNKPEDYLSERAIERRIRKNIPITETDLPVSQNYLKSIRDKNIEILHTSKWLNSATVYLSNKEQYDWIIDQGFVNQTICVKPSSLLSSTQPQKEKNIENDLKTTIQETCKQLEQVNGDLVHKEGYQGNQVFIAILDEGFLNADRFVSLEHVFNQNRVIGTKNFVIPSESVYTSDPHGAQVFSVLAGKNGDHYFGSAPKASYLLLQTEDHDSEYPIETEHWIAALEYADSLGVDVVNSSLGYYAFDSSQFDYKKEMFDGNHIRISRAANIGAEKGIVIVNSVGNEADDAWNYLTAPADASSIISVGSIDSNENLSSFSSPGPNQKGITKPDVVALGTNTTMETRINSIGYKSGTSYSTPIVAGMVACILEANNSLSSTEIQELLHQNASKSFAPDNDYGYGIPNFLEILKTQVETDVISKTEVEISVYPNPCNEFFKVETGGFLNDNCHYQLFDVLGNIVANGEITQNNTNTINVSHLKKGIYFFRMNCNTKNESIKLMKQ